MMHGSRENPEGRPLWLPSLYMAQAVVDSGMRLAVKGETLLRPHAPACARGCSGCCSRRDPAATALEAAGALIHLERKGLERKGAALVLERFLEPQGKACPFLDDGLCAVYPMRPLSCRQLMVFGRACGPGEDPLRTRPGDVLTPLPGRALRAYSLLLPFAGGPGASTPSSSVHGLHGLVTRSVKALSSLDREHVLELAGIARPGRGRAAA